MLHWFIAYIICGLIELSCFIANQFKWEGGFIDHSDVEKMNSMSKYNRICYTIGVVIGHVLRPLLWPINVVLRLFYSIRDARKYGGIKEVITYKGSEDEEDFTVPEPKFFEDLEEEEQCKEN